MDKTTVYLTHDSSILIMYEDAEVDTEYILGEINPVSIITVRLKDDKKIKFYNHKVSIINDDKRSIIIEL